MDEVYNAIRVRYKTPLENGGFETLATTWAHWVNVISDGNITDETIKTNKVPA